MVAAIGNARCARRMAHLDVASRFLVERFSVSAFNLHIVHGAMPI
jgi:hypothetical protein